MKYLYFVLVTIILLGCEQQVAKEKTNEAVQNDHENLVCLVFNLNDQDELKHCKSGQKITFTPTEWGNKQLPIMFASGHCDLRYTVVWTEGAVTCIYRKVDGPANYELEANTGKLMLKK